jgi:hypothetical protein
MPVWADDAWPTELTHDAAGCVAGDGKQLSGAVEASIKTSQFGRCIHQRSRRVLPDDIPYLHESDERPGYIPNNASNYGLSPQQRSREEHG